MTLPRVTLMAGILTVWLGGSVGAADPRDVIETAHVRVLSNASPATVAEIAGQLEAFRVTVDRTWRGLTRPLPDPVTVFAFKNDVSFDDYKAIPEHPGERVQGVTQKDEEGFLIALSARPRQAIENTRIFKSFQYPYETVFHEFTHLLLGTTISKLPVWVNEGIAVYASSFVVQSGQAELGRVRTAAPEWLKHEFLLAPDALLSLPSFNSLDPQTKDIAYKESWLLVFYLTQHGSPRAHQFGAFLSALLAGTPQAAAWSCSFEGATAEKIAREARAFYSRGTYTYSRVSVAALEMPSASDARPMAPRDA